MNRLEWNRMLTRPTSLPAELSSQKQSACLIEVDQIFPRQLNAYPLGMDVAARCSQLTP